MRTPALTTHASGVPDGSWVLAGATGVTGRLILQRALARGTRPTLLGRSAPRLTEIGERLDLPWGVAPLDNPHAISSALAGHRLVLNAAGPFEDTARPIMDAALAAGVDYVDVNGELGPLSLLLQRDAAARQAGIALVGGAGFGVAASDGLAALLTRVLGGADRVRVAVAADSAYASAGVAESTLRVLAGGGREVIDGALAPARLARKGWLERDGRNYASAPLAELVAILRVTGAREVVAGVPMGTTQARALRTVAPLLPRLVGIGPIRRAMASTGGHAGATGRATYRSSVHIVVSRGGREATGELTMGEGFEAAASIAVSAVEEMLIRRPAPGAYTPALAFGSEFIARVDGVDIRIDDA